MKHLKVCFIGCGDHARRFILPALAGAEHVTLSAICARTREHAEAAAARTGRYRLLTVNVQSSAGISCSAYPKRSRSNATTKSYARTGALPAVTTV